MARVLNRPCDVGRAAGVELARFADMELAKHPTLRERCNSCAFRLGTIPNGCLTTMADAFKCVIEGEPFYCHETPEPRALCAGWVALRNAAPAAIGTVPWNFTDEDDANG